MVGVIVGDEDLRDPLRIEAVLANEPEDLVGTWAEPSVDEHDIVPTVDEVRVAVQTVGEIEAVVSPSDQVDVLGEPHSLGTE